MTKESEFVHFLDCGTELQTVVVESDFQLVGTQNPAAFISQQQIPFELRTLAMFSLLGLFPTNKRSEFKHNLFQPLMTPIAHFLGIGTPRGSRLPLTRVHFSDSRRFFSEGVDALC